LKEGSLNMPFEILNQNEYLMITLKGDCQLDNTSKIFEKYKEQLKLTNIKLLIIQCSECSNIATPLIRELAQIFREIKAVNGQLRLVAANPQIVFSIRNNGLDRILVNKLSLRGALVDFGLVKSKDFDVNFINPFLNSTQKVLKIQASMETTPEKPYVKKPTDPLLLGDISGIISITSETFTGTLAISLSEEIFKKIASNMLGQEVLEVSESNVDLVGELANIILGQAKLELAKVGYAVQSALPSCVWGKDHKIKHFGTGICIVIPFKTEFGMFYAEVMTSHNLLAQVPKKTA